MKTFQILWYYLVALVLIEVSAYPIFGRKYNGNGNNNNNNDDICLRNNNCRVKLNFNGRLINLNGIDFQFLKKNKFSNDFLNKIFLRTENNQRNERKNNQKLKFNQQQQQQQQLLGSQKRNQQYIKRLYPGQQINAFGRRLQFKQFKIKQNQLGRHQPKIATTTFITDVNNDNRSGGDVDSLKNCKYYKNYNYVNDKSHELTHKNDKLYKQNKRNVEKSSYNRHLMEISDNVSKNYNKFLTIYNYGGNDENTPDYTDYNNERILNDNNNYDDEYHRNNNYYSSNVDDMDDILLFDTNNNRINDDRMIKEQQQQVQQENNKKIQNDKTIQNENFLDKKDNATSSIEYENTDEYKLKRNAFKIDKREKIKSSHQTQFIPSISVGAMDNLGDFFDNLKNNVDVLEKGKLTASEEHLLEGDHIISALRKQLLPSNNDENENVINHLKPSGTAAFLHAIRTYRPSSRIRALVAMQPDGYHGSNFLDPNYMWLGLGK